MMRIEPKRRQQALRQHVTDPRPPDHDVAVREIDDLENAVDHRVTQRNQRIQAADHNGRHQSFGKISQAGIPLVTRSNTAERASLPSSPPCSTLSHSDGRGEG